MIEIAKLVFRRRVCELDLLLLDMDTFPDERARNRYANIIRHIDADLKSRGFIPGAQCPVDGFIMVNEKCIVCGRHNAEQEPV